MPLQSRTDFVSYDWRMTASGRKRSVSRLDSADRVGRGAGTGFRQIPDLS